MNRSPQPSASRRPSGRPAAPLLVLALLAAMAAASPGALARQETPAVPGVPDPTVRVVHASPDAPPVDILIDGQPIAQGVAFGDATSYAALSPGDHHVQVVPADGGAPIVDQAITVGGWAAYLLVAVGPLADLQLTFNEVDVAEIGPGQARVRLHNAVPDAPPIGFGVAGSDALLADGVAFGAVSADLGAEPAADGTALQGILGYRDVTPGAYDLDVRASDTGETLLRAAGIRFDAGQVYDVVALGLVADGSVRILPLATPVASVCSQALGVGQRTDGCLRVIHAAPEAGPVDVYVGDAAVARGVAYGTATGFAAVPNGRQQLRVVPAGAAVDQAIVDMTEGLTAGSATQLMVSGVADDLQATLAGVDLRALPEHQARVRVVNASPDLGAIDVGVAGGSTPFEGIAFRDQSGYVVFDAGPAAFQLWQSGDDAVLLEVPEVPIEPGTVYDVVVFGQSGSGAVQVVVLDAAAGVLTGPSATPVAATPATALLATPAARVTPVAAVGDGTGGVSPSTATPAS